MTDIELVKQIIGFPGIELPSKYINTTDIPVGKEIHLTPEADLQSYLDAVIPGETLVLPQGRVYRGNFKLEPTLGKEWITIRGLGAPQQKNTRVSPYANLPKIITPNGNPAIRGVGNVSNIRFIGVEVHGEVNNTNRLIEFGEDAQTLDQVPSDIIFDRCYVHGFPEWNLRRAFSFQAKNSAIVNCHISEVHDKSFDSQGIAIWKTPGPIKIVNNYIEASAENVGFGGAGLPGEDFIPSDIEIRNNHFFKPLKWKTEPWMVKNLLEFKWGKRILVENNVFENNWRANQAGYAIVLTPRTQDGKYTFNVVRDLTFRSNILRNVYGGFNLLAHDIGGVSGKTENIAITNNLIDDIENHVFLLNGTNQGGFNNVIIRNNTVPEAHAIMVFNNGLQSTKFEASDNIFNAENYAIIGNGVNYVTVYDRYLAPDYKLKGNVFFNAPKWITFPNKENFIEQTIDGVGFENYLNGDYELSDISRYLGKGADINILNVIEELVRDGICPKMNYANSVDIFGLKIGNKVIRVAKEDIEDLTDSWQSA